MYWRRTVLQKAAIDALLAVEKPIYDLSKGKLAKNRFLSALDIPHVGTNVKIVKETDESTFIAKFNPDGSYDNSDFRILCTTDLHLDEDLELNNRTLQHMIYQIADLKPDLVVITGDSILSKMQQTDAVQFARMMERVGVYWAYTFGNHEAREEKGSFKYMLFKSLVDSPMCLSKFGREDLFGYGNFFINIMNGENSIRKSLVFFDSGRDIIEAYGVRDGVPADKMRGYDYIKPSQLEWYQNNIKALSQTYGKVESFVYQHIPVPEYAEFYKKQLDGSYVLNEGVDVVYGTMREEAGNSTYNSGQFDVMKKIGGQAMFCGHDHCNDFCIEKDGIYLVYNQTGGYNCYDLYEKDKLSPDPAQWPFGVSFTDVHSDGTFDFGHRTHAEFFKNK